MRGGRKRRDKGIVAVYFGVGFLFASFCPTQLLIIILSLAVIGLGITCAKC